MHHSFCRLGTQSGRLYLTTDHFGYHEWSHEQVKKFNDQTMQQNEITSINTELSVCSTQNDDDKTNVCLNPTNNARTFKSVEPVPDRSLWLPAVSKYEQKGYDEGRKTYLSCWELS
jgi:tRNA G46 methylase TrmB